MSKVAEDLLHHGRILDLVSETHQMPDDRQARFEIVQHPGGAAALPLLPDGRLILIRQFRPAAEGYILEIPAGRLEPGEDGAACIERELIEEIGYRAQRIEPLGYVYSTPGFCKEKIHLYLASELCEATTAHEPDEFIEPHIVTLEQALDMIAQGEIVDAKTQICLLRLAVMRSQQ